MGANEAILSNLYKVTLLAGKDTLSSMVIQSKSKDLEIPNFSQEMRGGRIFNWTMFSSDYIQILMCLIGQGKVFDETSELMEKLVGIELSGMQIQRVSEYYGSKLDPAIDRNRESCIPNLDDVKKEYPVYLMSDGSMLNTQDEKWKEIKLARIFSEDKILKLSEKRSEIGESIYVSHIGGVDVFLPKLERYLCGYENKVIIGDRARWIWKWAKYNYPRAIQILDFSLLKKNW